MQKPIDIDNLADLRGAAVDDSVGNPYFAGGHEAEMTRRESQVRIGPQFTKAGKKWQMPR
jgi:hypothetical protein